MDIKQFGDTAEKQIDGLRKYFLKKLQSWANDPVRTTHLEDQQYVRDEAEKMKERMAKGKMRSPILSKVWEVFDIQAGKLPLTYPYKAGKFHTDVSIIAAFLDHVYSKIGMAAEVATSLKKTRTDGLIWHKVGVDNGLILSEIKDPNYIICDPQATDGYAISWLDRGNKHRMIGELVGYKADEFDELFPEFKGLRGNPLKIDNDDGKTTQQRASKVVSDDEDEVYMLIIYAPNEFNEPVEMALVGSAAEIMYTEIGKGYKYKRKGLSGTIYELPFAHCVASNQANGIYAQSHGGKVIDIHVKYEKFISTVVNRMNQALHKVRILTGENVEDGAWQSEIMEAQILTEQGIDQIVAKNTGGNVNMTELGAGEDTIATFQVVRSILLAEASGRTGFMFQPAAETQKATIMLKMVQMENQAVSSFYAINEHNYFNRLATLVMMMSNHKDFKKNLKDVRLNITMEHGDEEIESSILETAIKEWDGEFRTDTMIKTPAAPQEVFEATMQLMQAYDSVTGVPYGTIQEIEPKLRALGNLSDIKGVSNLKYEDFLNMAKTKLDQVQQMQSANIPTDMPQVNAPALGEEAARELTPGTKAAIMV